jgi:hypothetical protein
MLLRIVGWLFIGLYGVISQKAVFSMFSAIRSQMNQLPVQGWKSLTSCNHVPADICVVPALSHLLQVRTRWLVPRSHSYWTEHGNDTQWFHVATLNCESGDSVPTTESITAAGSLTSGQFHTELELPAGLNSATWRCLWLRNLKRYT